VLYDVLNSICLHINFRKKCAEKELLFEHIKYTEAKDLLLLDRTYADYSVMAYLLKQERDFIIRFPHHGFKQVDEFFNSNETDTVVELKVTSHQKQFVTQQELAKSIRIRLVKVILDNGEVEVLGTSLLDSTYKVEDFKQLYGWRWGVETYFDRLKNIYELERFGGKSIHSIEQDIYGIAFLTTLESILNKSAEEELEQKSKERASQYKQQVNHSVSYSAMLDYIVDLLMNKQVSIEQTLEQLHQLFMTNPTPKRAGRNFPRKQS